MAIPDEVRFACPECGTALIVPVEPGDGRQQDFVVDCWICCHPSRLRLHFDDGGADVQVLPGND